MKRSAPESCFVEIEKQLVEMYYLSSYCGHFSDAGTLASNMEFIINDPRLNALYILNKRTILDLTDGANILSDIVSAIQVYVELWKGDKDNIAYKEQLATALMFLSVAHAHLENEQSALKFKELALKKRLEVMELAPKDDASRYAIVRNAIALGGYYISKKNYINAKKILDGVTFTVNDISEFGVITKGLIARLCSSYHDIISGERKDKPDIARRRHWLMIQCREKIVELQQALFKHNAEDKDLKLRLFNDYLLQAESYIIINDHCSALQNAQKCLKVLQDDIAPAQAILLVQTVDALITHFQGNVDLYASLKELSDASLKYHGDLIGSNLDDEGEDEIELDEITCPYETVINLHIAQKNWKEAIAVMKMCIKASRRGLGEVYSIDVDDVELNIEEYFETRVSQLYDNGKVQEALDATVEYIKYQRETGSDEVYLYRLTKFLDKDLDFSQMKQLMLDIKDSSLRIAKGGIEIQKNDIINIGALLNMNLYFSAIDIGGEFTQEAAVEFLNQLPKWRITCLSMTVNSFKDNMQQLVDVLVACNNIQVIKLSAQYYSSYESADFSKLNDRTLKLNHRMNYDHQSLSDCYSNFVKAAFNPAEEEVKCTFKFEKNPLACKVFLNFEANVMKDIISGAVLLGGRIYGAKYPVSFVSKSGMMVATAAAYSKLELYAWYMPTELLELIVSKMEIDTRIDVSKA